MAIDFKKWVRKDNLLILILSGVLLLVISLPTGKAGGRTQEQSQTVSGEGSRKESADQEGINVTNSEDSYVKELEQELESLIGRLDGVGAVQVMITLASSEEIVVEKDTPTEHSSSREEDSGGGSREITGLKKNEVTVFYQTTTGKEPYVIKKLPPRVEGVVVIAQGCGDGATAKNITELVQVLFDLEANHVKVLAMSSSGK